MIQKINHTYDTQIEKTLHLLGWNKVGMGGVLFAHPMFGSNAFHPHNALVRMCEMYDVYESQDDEQLCKDLVEAFQNRITPEMQYYNALRDIELQLQRDPIDTEAISNIVEQALKGK